MPSPTALHCNLRRLSLNMLHLLRRRSPTPTSDGLHWHVFDHEGNVVGQTNEQIYAHPAWACLAFKTLIHGTALLSVYFFEWIWQGKRNATDLVQALLQQRSHATTEITFKPKELQAITSSHILELSKAPVSVLSKEKPSRFHSLIVLSADVVTICLLSGLSRHFKTCLPARRMRIVPWSHTLSVE